MTSANLGKILEYLKVQEILRSENLTDFIYAKEYFYMFFSSLLARIPCAPVC